MAVHALAASCWSGTRLLILVLGVLIGLAIGCMPGLGGVVALAVLIPFTYNLDAPTSFALLLGRRFDSTKRHPSLIHTAVLFGVPGTVGAAADRHRRPSDGAAGKRRPRFGAGFVAAAVGGLFGAFVLALAIPAAAASDACGRFAGIAGIQHFRAFDGRHAVGPRTVERPHRGRAWPHHFDDRIGHANRHAALDLQLALSLRRHPADPGNVGSIRASRTRRSRHQSAAHRRQHDCRSEAFQPMAGRRRRLPQLVAGAEMQRTRHRARHRTGHRLGGDRLDRLRLRRAHREEPRQFSATAMCAG